MMSEGMFWSILGVSPGIAMKGQLAWIETIRLNTVDGYEIAIPDVLTIRKPSPDVRGKDDVIGINLAYHMLMD